jgi:AraC-like DNA-binding protein
MADDTPEVASAEDRFLAQVRDAILEHLAHEDFGVQELADAVFMSRRQLGRKLTALIGEPPSVLIRRIRVQRGRALIEQGAGTLSEIAYAIGYRRPARFSEQFRAEFGMSPSEFKDGLDGPGRPGPA